jgi:hypothetical protein
MWTPYRSMDKLNFNHRERRWTEARIRKPLKSYLKTRSDKIRRSNQPAEGIVGKHTSFSALPVSAIGLVVELRRQYGSEWPPNRADLRNVLQRISRSTKAPYKNEVVYPLNFANTTDLNMINRVFAWMKATGNWERLVRLAASHPMSDNRYYVKFDRSLPAAVVGLTSCIGPDPRRSDLPATCAGLRW